MTKSEFTNIVVFSLLLFVNVGFIKCEDWTPQIVDGPHVWVNQDLMVAEDLDEILASNNNVGGIIHEGRLFMAWRSSPTHFASSKTRMHAVSSDDMGQTWRAEFSLHIEKDMREPHFLSINGTLFFYYFEAGTNPIAFEPGYLQRKQYLGPDQGWTQSQSWGQESEVAWQYVVADDTAYVISYAGMHYSLTELGQVSLYLNKSTNGIDWEPVGPSPFYEGGISEVGWAFDGEGIMWGIGRNEDGDKTGWGSRVFFYDLENMEAPQWTSEVSDPHIYESPRMFEHEGEIYLVARTDPQGPFMSAPNRTTPLEHLYDLVSFSFRPHGTALWRLNRESGVLVKLLDLPGCGDTAFPSIMPLDDHTFLILNYSNHFEHEGCADWPWVYGQVAPEGTLIYAITIEFVATH